MPDKIASLVYKFIKALVRLFYPRIEVVGTEKLPEEPVVVVANHSKMNGPIACELYFPGKHCTWCAEQMMHLREVPIYAFQDFWSRKPKASRWFYRILSYLIAPLSVCVFNHASTIPVYHDLRLRTTFRLSMDRLDAGSSIIIFPECDEEYNNILCAFQDRFIDLARLYYKKTGIRLSFVPMYIAPALKKMYLGDPIRFQADVPIKDERARICAALMEQITAIAQALPEHTVVPYRNIPKKDYPSNLPERDITNENACR